jgi:hypothetical protein
MFVDNKNENSAVLNQTSLQPCSSLPSFSPHLPSLPFRSLPPFPLFRSRALWRPGDGRQHATSVFCVLLQSPVARSRKPCACEGAGGRACLRGWVCLWVWCVRVRFSCPRRGSTCGFLLDEAVTSGTFQLDVKMNGIKV